MMMADVSEVRTASIIRAIIAHIFSHLKWFDMGLKMPASRSP
jgi:hypothetical protein